MNDDHDNAQTDAEALDKMTATNEAIMLLAAHATEQEADELPDDLHEVVRVLKSDPGLLRRLADEADAEPKIETLNDFGFSIHLAGGVEHYGTLLPTSYMTAEQALRLAAWIVTLIDPLDVVFPKIRKAIEAT